MALRTPANFCTVEKAKPSGDTDFTLCIHIYKYMRIYTYIYTRLYLYIYVYERVFTFMRSVAN